MLAAVLLVSGAFATAYGGWRGYVAARAALLPLVREGDPTRALLDAARPVHARTRVRIVARNVALAAGWLGIAMYGLYLVTVGLAAPA
jgi:hypothetical protein